MKTLTLDMFPSKFKIISAVIADWHMYTILERAFEEFLRARGLRIGWKAWKDALWRWMTDVDKNMFLARELAARISNVTPYVVSLGDHFGNIVNPIGLSEPRARLCAILVREFFRQFDWKMLHVPADHDIGTPHRATSSELLKKYYSLAAEFEKTAAYRKELTRIVLRYGSVHPDLIYLLRRMRQTDSSAFDLSKEVYSGIHGPLFGTRALSEEVDAVWASDMLAASEDESPVSAVQTPFLKKELGTESDKQKVLFIHAPQALKYIGKLLGDKKPQVARTIAGHIHIPTVQYVRFLPSTLIKFKLGICPSLTDNNLPVKYLPGGMGGGCLFLGMEEGRVRLMRYSLKKNKLRYVRGLV